MNTLQIILHIIFAGLTIFLLRPHSRHQVDVPEGEISNEQQAAIDQTLLESYRLKWRMNYSCLLLWFIFLVPILYHWTKTIVVSYGGISPSDFEEELQSLFWFLIVAYFSLCGLRKVGPQKIGTIVFFGRPIIEASSGPHFAPRLICSLPMEPKTIVNFDFPGPPEKIDQIADDEHPLREGMVFPFRVMTGDLTTLKITNPGKYGHIGKEYEENPLAQQIAIELIISIQVKIKWHSQFLSNAEDFENVSKNLDRIVRGTIHQMVPRMLYAEFLVTQEEIYKEITNRIKKMIGDNPKTQGENESWGLELISISFNDVVHGKTMNISLNNRATSLANATATITIAKAERVKRAEEGKGTAEAVKAMAEVVDDHDGAIRLAAIDMLKETLPSTKLIVAPGLEGLASSVRETLSVFDPDKNKPREGGES